MGLRVWAAISLPLALLAGRILRTTNPALLSELESYLRQRTARSLRRTASSLALLILVTYGLLAGTSGVDRLPRMAVVTQWATSRTSATTTPETPTSSVGERVHNQREAPSSATPTLLASPSPALDTSATTIETLAGTATTSTTAASSDDEPADEEVRGPVPAGGGSRWSPATTTTTTEPPPDSTTTSTTSTTEPEPEPTTTTTTSTTVADESPDPGTTTTSTTEPPANGEEAGN